VIQIVVCLVQSVPEPSTSYMAAFRVLRIGKALRNSLSCNFLLLSIRQKAEASELLPTHTHYFSILILHLWKLTEALCV
jgi:hypothetical protein